MVLLVVSVGLLVGAIVWNPQPAAMEGPTTGLKVIVLGVDGLDWFLLSKYAESGQLPNIGRIMRSAVSGEMGADTPTLPQVGWTIVGRGTPLTESEAAVVEGQGDRRLFGIVPALASLVQNAGGRALAVGWPTSWPLPREGGPAIAPYPPASSEHTRSLAPALFDGAPGEAVGEEYEAIISEAVGNNMETVNADFESNIHAGCDNSQPESENLTAVKWGYLADRIALDTAGRLIAEEEPDLALVYMGGLDAAMHRFLGQAAPEYFEGLELGSPSCSDVVPNYYTFVDSAVARLLRLTDERTIFILMSAYGTHPSTSAPPSTAGHELNPPGVFMVRGPHLPQQSNMLNLTTVDVAPTLLAALGLPVPMEMSGRVVTDVLPEGLLEQFPVQISESATGLPESIPTPPECVPMDNRVDDRLGELRVSP